MGAAAGAVNNVVAELAVDKMIGVDDGLMAMCTVEHTREVTNKKRKVID